MKSSFNLGHELEIMARDYAHMPAIIFPAGREGNKGRFVQFTFQQLDDRVNQYANGLQYFGVKRGERTLVMLKPGVDLISVVFALMKLGAVPVLIDPGMGFRAFLQCVSESEPTTMIGIPIAHWLRRLFPKSFRTLQKNISSGRSSWGCISLEQVHDRGHAGFSAVETGLEEEAAVAFTSGGTGIPKGVVYEHGMFKEQIARMKDTLGIQVGEVHMAAMYIFALFNPALGVTTVIPDMDPRKTAQLNPAYLVEAIETFGVTLSLGSPTVWRIVGQYCQEKGISLPSLKHIFMFGAPVYPDLVETFGSLMPHGHIQTPYGATEALPLTTIKGNEILDQTAKKTLSGKGVCVGPPVSGVEICIIPISDHVIGEMNQIAPCPNGDWGEICVRGKMVTKSYLNRPQQTALAKIKDGDTFWHRMGDVGYKDDQGRIWVCGRKTHRVETHNGLLMPICCEAIFNTHPGVFRSALVGLGPMGAQSPIILIETKQKMTKGQFRELTTELRDLASQYDISEPISEFVHHPGFPVDVRHNAKIQRQELAKWLQKRGWS